MRILRHNSHTIKLSIGIVTEFACFNRLTKLKESLFGLPIVLAGSYLGWASCVENPFSWRLLAIIPAFFGARVSGMAFNQLIDRTIDAKNPRTQERVLPSGEVDPQKVKWIAISSLLVCVASCAILNWLCFGFSLLASFLLILYSYTKRFTASCHLVLGLIHLLAPCMAFIALTGVLSLPPLLLGMSACCLIMGNDIFYAMQDLAFDKAHHLHSLPAKWGISLSACIAFSLHLLSCIGFVFLGLLLESFWVAILLPLVSASLFLIFDTLSYRTIRQRKLLGATFFYSNFCISMLLLGLIFLGGVL